jgi:hypothetical protein
MGGAVVPVYPNQPIQFGTIVTNVPSMPPTLPSPGLPPAMFSFLSGGVNGPGAPDGGGTFTFSPYALPMAPPASAPDSPAANNRGR